MRFPAFILSLCAGLFQMGSARNISWFSDPEKINQTAGGSLMDAGFRLELGVFESGFTPTPQNVSEWARHWHVCQRQTYNSSTKRFDGLFAVTDNSGPFAVGTAAYVWGFRSDGSGDWILFRTLEWNLPAADPSNPIPLEWNVAEATALIGSINASGSPYLMRSAVTTDALPPATDWNQWSQDEFTGEPLNQASDDPDRDGIANLLEFVFGTSPLSPDGPVPTPLSLIAGHPTIIIPRRADHTSTLKVEVSNDLIHWQSGPGFTEVVEDSIGSLVVRDLTPMTPDSPPRFMRVRAEVP
jgi:hypothetical protein